MRTSGSDKGSFLPDSAVGENSATHGTLTFDDNRLAALLLGQSGQNLALTERRTRLGLAPRRNEVNLLGAGHTP